jgi:hypothetical protein
VPILNRISPLSVSEHSCRWPQHLPSRPFCRARSYTGGPKYSTNPPVPIGPGDRGTGPETQECHSHLRIHRQSRQRDGGYFTQLKVAHVAAFDHYDRNIGIFLEGSDGFRWGNSAVQGCCTGFEPTPAMKEALKATGRYLVAW